MSFILPCRSLQRGFSRYLALLLLTGLVAGCAGFPPVAVPGADSGKLPSAQTAASQPAQSDAAYALLQRAEQAVSPERDQLLLQAAVIYEQRADTARLGRTLQEIHASALTGKPLQDYSLVYSQWAIGQLRLADAEVLLLNPALEEGLQGADAARLHGLRATLYEKQNKLLDALNSRLQQSVYAPETSQREISETTWRLLSQLRQEDIAFLQHSDTDNPVVARLLEGWLALLHIQRSDAADLERQLKALRDWQRDWPMHPASRYMPAEMANLGMQRDGQARRVALLLPLSGKRSQAGKAIRDGFMTMHYRHLAQGDTVVQVDLVDSNLWPDILTAYQHAVGLGAQVVIGPLEREQVQVLAGQAQLPVPTLALNNPATPDNALPAAGELYRFSLNPEDDVLQVADAAAAARFRRALVIAPQDGRGERLMGAFSQRWAQLGGELATPVRYQPGNINISLQLAQSLGITLATGQLQPGADLPDLVFFAGQAADVATVIETLTRNGAGSIPVYALAQALPPTGAVAAMNGMRVCVSPWQAGSGPLRASAEPPSPGADILFAMGADARELYPQLQSLRSSDTLTVPGNTGYLSMDAGRRIVRRLVWGVVQDGQLQTLPTAGGR